MTPDLTWPCRCGECAPPNDCCDRCGVAAGQVCSANCEEHPSQRKPCPALACYPEPRIARGDS